MVSQDTLSGVFVNESWLPHGAERAAMLIGGALGGAMSFAFGDVGPFLVWLGIFVLADLFTGTAGALRTGTWESRRFGAGITKKVVYFSIVALAHGLDKVFQPIVQVEVMEYAVICAYAAGEFGSILENLERCGLGDAVPPSIRKLIKALNDRVDKTIDRIPE